MRARHPISLVAGIAAAILLSACGQQDAGPVATAEPAATMPAALPKMMSAEGASVFFITPTDGATVSNPVVVEFGIEGMSVVAAGVNEAHSGHHHLLIDTAVPDLNLPIPADGNHVHFGNAATATELTLAPGQHTLQLLLGDHLHIPHDPAVMSATITITVE